MALEQTDEANGAMRYMTDSRGQRSTALITSAMLIYADHCSGSDPSDIVCSSSVIKPEQGTSVKYLP